MNNKIKHLEMIENVISRMAKNSFMIKGWTLSLIAGLFAFLKIDKRWYLAILILPIIVFCFLDAYYLNLERRYRSLYEIVRKKEEDQIDFDLKLNKECISLNKFYKSLFSKTILIFYFTLIVLVSCFYLLPTLLVQ